MPKNWPKLSETLPLQVGPDRCHQCGDTGEIARWLEHDECDQPVAVIICLCRKCSERIIEPHPRLYRELDPSEPFPGAMGVCLDCPARDGVVCCSPLAQINGGPGLVYEPMPSRAHVCRSPRSKSGWMWFGGQPTKCSGKNHP
jgi:hypothetical protein